MPGRGSSTPTPELRIFKVRFTTVDGQPYLMVHFNTGTLTGLPLTHFPSLANATPAQRRNWELIGGGYGIYWPALDLDLSAKGLAAGLTEQGTSPAPRKPKRGSSAA